MGVGSSYHGRFFVLNDRKIPGVDGSPIRHRDAKAMLSLDAQILSSCFSSFLLSASNTMSAPSAFSGGGRAEA